MSFPRRREIYPCDKGTVLRPCPRSSSWMSLQLGILGGLLSSRARVRFPSRSYTATHQPRRPMPSQRPVICSLTTCLSRGVHFTASCKVTSCMQSNGQSCANGASSTLPNKKIVSRRHLK
jgi:hypothetical protein